MAIIRYHCTKCHHEWDTGEGSELIPSQSRCDWCEAPGLKIASYPSLDYNKLLKKLQDLSKEEK